MERWRDVIGYEGLYQVSDLGRVRSVDRVVHHYRGGPCRLKGRIIRAVPHVPIRYLAVGLHKDGHRRVVYIHRLVMAAWVGPCPVGHEVRHGPEGVADNSVGNLCYGTRSENMYDGRRDGTGRGRSVTRDDGVEFVNMIVAGEETGCAHQSIWACCNGRIKTAGGFTWKYREN